MFKNSILKYSIPRRNRKQSKLRNSIRFLEAKSIGVVFCSDSLEKHQYVKNLISEIEGLGKEVDVLTFLGKGKDNHEFLFNYFTKKDFSAWGKMENDHVKSFLSKDLDFLLCFDFDTNLYVKYILAYSKAKCRIGAFSDDSEQFLELMVKPNSKNIEDLVSTIKQYTLSLN